MGHEPADPLGHVGPEAAPRPPLGPYARGDSRDEHRAQREGGRIRRERQRHAGREQECADRRCDQLVGEQEGALHPRVGDAQVLARYQTGEQGAACRVGERLRRAQEEQHEEDQRDVDGAADDRRDEREQYDGARKVHDDDHPPSIETVGGHAAYDTEQQHREVLAQQRHRHQEGVACL